MPQCLALLSDFTRRSKTRRRRAAKAEEARIQANREAVQEQQSRVERLNELTRRYNELSGKETLNYSEQREMVSIKREMADAYGVIAENANAAAEAQRNYNAALDEASRKELQELLATKKQASQDAYVAANSDDYLAAMKKYASALKDQREAQEALATTEFLSPWDAETARDSLVACTAEVEKCAKELDTYKGGFSDWFNTTVDEHLTAAQAGGEKVNQAMADFLTGIFDIDLAGFEGDTTAANGWVDSMVLGLVDACKDADTAEALEAARGIMDNVLTGAAPTDADVDTFTTAWATIFNPEGTITPWLEMISEATGMGAAGFAGNPDGGADGLYRLRGRRGYRRGERERQPERDRGGGCRRRKRAGRSGRIV